LAAGRARRYGGIKPLAPIGPNGESIIDLIAGDAYAAGFEKIVVVVNPDTGPVIREHIESHWPAEREVAFAVQEIPSGTVNAVLAAEAYVDITQPFGVANADDLYGRQAMMDLGAHLLSSDQSCLVGFRLSNALVGSEPVTRGVCVVRGPQLAEIHERRGVTLVDGQYIATDGLEPSRLDAHTVVSMNLWGFNHDTWTMFQTARDTTEHSVDAELLLPDIVGHCVSTGQLQVDVIVSESRCVGVTHPGDLDVVQRDIREQIERGDRPATIFAA
jgi:choline kinase